MDSIVGSFLFLRRSLPSIVYPHIYFDNSVKALYPVDSLSGKDSGEMKILFINGSPRKGGNTARLLTLLGRELDKQAGTQGSSLTIERCDLAARSIAPCRGCRVCFDRGEDTCPQKDDIPKIYRMMQNADLIAAASPVYVDDVSGAMKNMIDRLAYLCHRPGLAGKGAYLLTTTGTTPSPHALGAMAMAFRTWGARVLGQASFVTGALMDTEDMEVKYHKKIEKTARRILKAMTTGKAAGASLISLIFFHIQRKSCLRNPDDSLDYQYWTNQGWLSKGRDDYIPRRAGFLKRAAARAIGAIIALFVLK